MVEVNKEELAVIRELETLTCVEIPQIKSRELKPYSDIGYRLDNEGSIVGLSLFSCDLKDISLLVTFPPQTVPVAIGVPA